MECETVCLYVCKAKYWRWKENGDGLDIFSFQLFFFRVATANYLPASSSLTPTAFMSSLTTSINLLSGLPLVLLPGSSNLSVSSLHTSKPPQSGQTSNMIFPDFISRTSNVICPCDVLIPDEQGKTPSAGESVISFTQTSSICHHFLLDTFTVNETFNFNPYASCHFGQFFFSCWSFWPCCSFWHDFWQKLFLWNFWNPVCFLLLCITFV